MGIVRNEGGKKDKVLKCCSSEKIAELKSRQKYKNVYQKLPTIQSQVSGERT